MRLIHITDPHLTALDQLTWRRLRGKRLLGYQSWWRRRRRIHRREVLDALMAAVYAERPDLLLVTGDLAHIGLPEEIAAARAWLDEVAARLPLLLVPGNHDVYAAGAWPAIVALWPEFMRPALLSERDPAAGFPCLREIDGVALIGLNSARVMPWLLAAGELGAPQRGRLDAMLGELGRRGLFRCVLLHHPPLPGLASARRALRDAGALAQIMARHGAELVLHGHLHRDHALQLPAGTAVFGTASASSADPAAPASYRVFDVEGGAGAAWRVRMRLQVRAGSGAFMPAAERSWQRAAAPPAPTSA